MKGVLLSFVFLASVLVVPIGYSSAETENENNSTLPVLPPVSTGNYTNHKLSDLMHQVKSYFNQQRQDTVNIIKECREKFKNTSNDTKAQVKEECLKKFQAIKDKYKDQRKQMQEQYVQIRKSMAAWKHGMNGMKLPGNYTGMENKIRENLSKNGTLGLEQELKHLKEMKLQHALKEFNKTKNHGPYSMHPPIPYNENKSSNYHENNDNGDDTKRKP